MENASALTEEKIRQIVNEEIDRRWRKIMQAIYPPELLQGLQSRFPFLKCGSYESQDLQE